MCFLFCDAVFSLYFRSQTAALSRESCERSRRPGPSSRTCFAVGNLETHPSGSCRARCVLGAVAAPLRLSHTRDSVPQGDSCSVSHGAVSEVRGTVQREARARRSATVLDAPVTG